MKPVTAVLFGAGERGMHTYAPYALAHPDELRFVAVAEPNEAKRAMFQQRYQLPDEACFRGYAEFFERPIPADCALVCTQDQMHVEPAMLAMARGYHVLLEKPMATTEAECRLLARTAQEQNRLLMVCHVLRYAPFYTALKQLLAEEAIGRLMTIQHMEGIAYWHFAHSFVRGNWGVTSQSAPMILAKCCHDLDLLQWLSGGSCVSLSSSGSLSHFTAQNAPEGAPAFCMDGCPQARACLYYAPNIYLGDKTGWPASVVSVDQSLAGRTEAIRSGPYGRCVYRCDNDVCDHQSVDMLFDNQVTANLTATAFSTDINRVTTLTGTKGTIEADFHASRLLVKYHGTGRVEEIKLSVGLDVHRHGGGDWRLLQDFLDLVAGGRGEAKTLVQDSLVSHLMAFAAEASRKDGVTVRM